MFDFDWIELKIQDLMSKMNLDDVLKVEVQGYIDVGEYGLALQTLVDIIVEENLNISDDHFKDITVLAKKMSIENEVLTEDLRSHVLS